MVSIEFIIVAAISAISITLACSDIDWFGAPDDDSPKFSQFDINDCLADLGKSPVELERAEIVWMKVKNSYEDISLIPTDVFAKMEWLLVGIPISDLVNITFGDSDIISVFGKYRNFKREQLQTIADRVHVDWWWKTPQKLSHFDLVTLNQILCYYNSTEILKIHSDAYK